MKFPSGCRRRVENVWCLIFNDSRGNKFWFRKIFVETLDQFPSYFIQSKPSASTHEYSESNNGGNKFRFWKIFVEVLDQFPSYFIQSKPCELAQALEKTPKAKTASKSAMLLSSLWNEHLGLGQLSKFGSRHKLAPAAAPPGPKLMLTGNHGNCTHLRGNLSIEVIETTAP